MTATTPIDAASRPRRSPTRRLRHSRSQLAACDGGQDRLELLVILFARARQADCGTSLLHRDGRRGNRRQRSGGSQGSDVSGAMQPDMSWPDGLKAQGFSGPPVISIARASGWSHGGVGDAELRTSLEQGTTAARDGGRGPEAIAGPYVRWCSIFVGRRLAVGNHRSKVQPSKTSLSNDKEE